MDLATLQKVTIDDVTLSKDNMAWEIKVTQTHDSQSHPTVEVKIFIPVDLIAWRVAEYGLDPGDMDTLIDVMVCERYLSPDQMQPDTVPLWNEKTITEARVKYMDMITATKLKYRISTRGAESKLNTVRELTAEFHPADIGLKALGVIMHRHRTKKQELDPDVFRAITYLEKAAARQDQIDNPGKGNSTSVDRKGR